MIRFICLLILFSPIYIHSYRVKIDGLIDLGPNWNYQYKVSEEEIPIEVKPRFFAETDTEEQPRPYKIKDNGNITKFMLHVYKQALKVFDALKTKTNDERIKKRVDVVTRNYKLKFSAFVNETQEYKVKTRAGHERVILNTIDMSNRILQRLLNHLLIDVNSNNLRTDAVSNVFRKEFDREKEVEYKHICKKFKICRNGHSFTNFLTVFFTEIIRNDNTKIKQASDALTEVLKNADLDRVATVKSKKHIYKLIEAIENSNANDIKIYFIILKNVIGLKNRPVAVTGDTNSAIVNRTVAFLDLLDIFDSLLPANEENVLEWNDLTASLKGWTEGRRDDVLDIMQTFIRHIKKKGVDKMDADTESVVKKKVAIVVKPIHD